MIPYYPLPDEFKVLGQGTLAGIPYSVFIAVAIVLIAHFVIKKTSYGRTLMAVGGNREASRVSGINVKRVLFSAHVLVSLLAGFVGIIMAARLSSAQPNAGDGWEMTAVAAVIIDGKFVGLALDDVNESGKTEERINNWIEEIKKNL